MKTPPFLLLAALLFWGWRAELLWVGAVTGILLELSLVLKGRWDFSNKEYNRLWDICTILFFGVGLYFRFSEEINNAAYKFILWLPIIFFPMALGQAYSAREKIPTRAFSWFLRRKKENATESALNISWIYFGLVVVCAGASNLRDIWFYLCISLLIGWAAWVNRTYRFPAAAWGLSFFVAVGIGFLTHMQLPSLQTWFEGYASELLTRFAKKDFDPRESRTAMGRLGRMKQSSRIVLRVQSEEGPVPERLRQGTYDTFRDEIWRSNYREFKKVPIESDTTTWTLSNDTNGMNLSRVTSRFAKERAMLSLPLTTAQILELPVDSVETNEFRAARALGNPALASYLAVWGGPTDDEPPPRFEDRVIEEKERDAIVATARELQIFDLPDREMVEAVQSFFFDFKYTTYQESQEMGLHQPTPLGRFLLETRAGHCEYFATATVLLLRHLGIPARYVTGYSVQEKSGETYIVRERHAHAWVLAYIDRQWVEVDTTPAGWEREEVSEFAFYQDLQEHFARLAFAFTEFRWLNTTGWIGLAAPWLMLAMAGYLGWRLFGRRFQKARKALRHGEWPGADSDLFLLEKKLTAVGLPRQEGETTAEWLTRTRDQIPGIESVLRELLTLHYRYRFDPLGIQNREREQLRILVKGVLAQNFS